MRRIKNGLLLVSVWIAILVVIGGAFELYFVVADTVKSSNNPDKLEHIIKPEFGVWREPNQKSRVYKRECYTNTGIDINRYGMRDDEVNPKKRVKVGYFGDSMIQGIEVSEDDHFLFRLNRIDSTREHLNFSMGGTGTASQYFNFLYHSGMFELDEVFLCVYSSNDVWNNSYDISVVDGWVRDLPVPYFRKDSQTGEIYVDRSRIDWRYKWYGKLHVLRILENLWMEIYRRLRYKFQFDPYSVACEGEKVDFQEQRYHPKCNNPVWKEAMATTQYIIKRFDEECKKREIKFNVMLLPVGNRFPDSNREILELERFLKAGSIPFINLIPYAEEYIEQNGVKPPYLSHECDMHYSAAGHDVMLHGLKTWFGLSVNDSTELNKLTVTSENEKLVKSQN